MQAREKKQLCGSQIDAELGAVDHDAELSTKIYGAKLGAKIYGVELGNTSAPREQLLWPAPQGSAPYTAAPTPRVHFCKSFQKRSICEILSQKGLKNKKVSK